MIVFTEVERFLGPPMRYLVQRLFPIWLGIVMPAVLGAQEIEMADFLSSHESGEKVVRISTEPATIYFEDARDSVGVNFDFVLKNQSDRELVLRFIKVAVYDRQDKLVTYRFLNHNGVGTPGIHSLGNLELQAGEETTLYNPFHSFPQSMEIAYLRYMFTYADKKTKQEYYYGNVLVTPTPYRQAVKLDLPVKGVSTILDGHDYFSHHRRFSPTILRRVTHGQAAGNFSRYALDFVLIGENGSLRRLHGPALAGSYDFHVSDARNFYTDRSPVYSPADGVVVEVQNGQDDLYDSRFDLDKAVAEEQLKRIAGNYVVVQHNDHEFSHLFHFLKGSIVVEQGQQVKSGQLLGVVGFSGAATTYSHLHYQLMDGPDFLAAETLPAKFSDVTLRLGEKTLRFDEVVLDTGDIILN